MFSGIRITGIATLLISFQVLNTTVFHPRMKLSLPNSISSKQTLVTSLDKSLQGLDKMAQVSSDFQPKDNGGLEYTRGSGTR